MLVFSNSYVKCGCNGSKEFFDNKKIELENFINNCKNEKLKKLIIKYKNKLDFIDIYEEEEIYKVEIIYREYFDKDKKLYFEIKK